MSELELSIRSGRSPSQDETHERFLEMTSPALLLSRSECTLSRRSIRSRRESKNVSITSASGGESRRSACRVGMATREGSRGETRRTEEDQAVADAVAVARHGAEERRPAREDAALRPFGRVVRGRGHEVRRMVMRMREW